LFYLQKDFNQNKNLIVLRSCNELLRRLSRAEDAVFCGRVFIFLFQSFPLGDKSSVNLRGEFHVENVTTFEESATPLEEAGEAMDVDSGAKEAKEDETAQSKTVGDRSTKDTHTASSKKGASRKGLEAPNTDKLYPIFWTLQQSFSNPLRLFNEDYFKDLKTGLDMTIRTFKTVPKVLQTKHDDGKRGIKRKHGEGHDQFANTFNPKYLTSRDLFKLEVRHIYGRRGRRADQSS
jgi:THO complex subunit 1